MTESVEKKIKDLSQRKTLSGVLRSDSFFYTILNENKDSLNICQSDIESIKSLSEFNSGRVGVKSPFFSIVDKAFLDNNDEIVKRDFYCDYLNGTAESYCIYRKPNLSIDSSIGVKHFLTVLNEYFNDIQSLRFVYFDDFHIHFYIKTDHQLRYYNEFHFTTDKDVLYFIKLVEGYFKTSNVLPWQVSGKITPDSKIFTLLTNYIEKIEIFRIDIAELQFMQYHEDIAFTLLCE